MNKAHGFPDSDPEKSEGNLIEIGSWDKPYEIKDQADEL